MRDRGQAVCKEALEPGFKDCRHPLVRNAPGVAEVFIERGTATWFQAAPTTAM